MTTRKRQEYRETKKILLKDIEQRIDNAAEKYQEADNVKRMEYKLHPIKTLGRKHLKPVKVVILCKIPYTPIGDERKCEENQNPTKIEPETIRGYA